jgi:putative tryptophan/tyrosine transport system substrate-binding protein
MAIDIGRRQFISALGGAVAAWPIAARAQQPAMPVIGYLSSRTLESDVSMLAAFRQGLGAAGYVENSNVAMEYRFAGGQYDRHEALAMELVRRNVAVIVSVGTSALAAKAATSQIPIVFNVGTDPVHDGLVASLNRPGGNLTGVYSLSGDLVAKRLGLLHELVTKAEKIVVLANPTADQAQVRDARAAAATLGLQIDVLNARTESEIETAFASLNQQSADAMLVVVDPFFVSRAAQITALAARHGVPAIYGRRPFAEAGGLISYGDDVAYSYRQAGLYTGRILKGEQPGDLPVVQTNKFELIINLKTAKALGLTIPPPLLALTDEVIE